MWRDTLFSEVLEEFCDPRWDGMALRDEVANGHLVVVRDDTNLGHVVRKSDPDIKSRVLQVAKRKSSWLIADLVKAAQVSGNAYNSAGTCCARILQAAGWTKGARKHKGYVWQAPTGCTSTAV